MKKLTGSAVIKATFSIAMLILIGIWLTSIDKRVWSKAGSMNILVENGVVETTKGVFIYRDNDSVLSVIESSALSTLNNSKEVKFYYIPK